ncbi:MAG: hypothetical protein INR70_10580 [Parafilimonas terrae]|nr:hypothetical protein [Parafilimonas terrae]
MVTPLFIPDADPAHAPADHWIAATGFEPVVPPGTSGRGPGYAQALTRATDLTSKAGRPTGESGELTPEAAKLHVLAAELRREAGEWSLCAENYGAVTRHFLATKDHKPALAYLRRYLFVADWSAQPSLQIEAYLLAAEVYAELRHESAASKFLKQAAAAAVKHADFDALTRVSGRAAVVRATLDAQSATGDTRKSGLPYDECKDVDREPAEFLFRAVGFETSPSRPASSPWWSIPNAGIDVMMELPGPAGDAPYWVAHGVRDGCHHLDALPNWSARAMRSAQAMRAYAAEHPDGFEGPSSAVLQVACALESFINTVIHFIGHDGCSRFQGGRHGKAMLAAGEEAEERIKGKAERTPEQCTADELAVKKTRLLTNIIEGSKHKNSGELFLKWVTVGEFIFGPAWTALNRLDDLRLMMKLRSALVHYKEDNIEQIVPPGSRPHELASAFERHPDFKDARAIRPGPMPWVDRLLTPHLAGWAVTLGDELIAGFRASWRAEAEDFERQERFRAWDDEAWDDEPSDEAA